MKKDCMFQYALGNPPIFQDVIIESTDLITMEEAEKLWDKYYPDCVKRLKRGDEPQMCIWIDCQNETNYGKKAEGKDIDYRDNLVIEHGKIYKLEKKRIV